MIGNDAPPGIMRVREQKVPIKTLTGVMKRLKEASDNFEAGAVFGLLREAVAEYEPSGMAPSSPPAMQNRGAWGGDRARQRAALNALAVPWVRPLAMNGNPTVRDEIWLYGTGGHAGVVLDIISSIGDKSGVLSTTTNPCTGAHGTAIRLYIAMPSSNREPPRRPSLRSETTSLGALLHTASPKAPDFLSLFTLQPLWARMLLSGRARSSCQAPP